MKKIIVTLLVALLAFSLVACQNQPTQNETTEKSVTTTEMAEKTSASESSEPEMITIKVANESNEMVDLEVPLNPQRIVVLDYMALDMIDALGLGDRIVGVSTQVIPSYLSKYADNKDIVDLGALHFDRIDREEIMSLKPDIIFTSGRTAKYYKEFSEIAPTVMSRVNYADGTINSFEKVLKRNASIFAVEDKADAIIKAYQERVKNLQEKAKGKTAVISLTTGGTLNTLGNDSRGSMISNDIGFENLATDVDSTHGDVSSFEVLVDLDPDYVFVLDRDTAIAEEGSSSAQALFDNELVKKTKAYKNDNIVFLNPAPWYLAEGGVTAMNLMLKDLESAFASTSKPELGGTITVYSTRHYDTDAELFKKFTEKTGVEVVVVKDKGNVLLEKLKSEGSGSDADIFYTADAGNLEKAKAMELFQPLNSEVINKNIPANLRDDEDFWTGLTVRARVILYALDRVDPSDLSTYEDLADPKWKGRILVRSSSNQYNISLVSSFIDDSIMGEEKAREWTKAFVSNFARDPKGNDRDQGKAVYAGEGDIAIMNTYYLGRMLADTKDEEMKKAAENLGVFFPNQETTGAHINVSGAGILKTAENKEAAVAFLEFLSGEEAQEAFSSRNYEFPANPSIEVKSELLKSFGTFKTQNINLSVLGDNATKASEIMDEANWK